MKRIAFFLLMVALAATTKAQCTFRNTAFTDHEFLTYNLYYNWKFVWVKAGTASMYTVGTTHRGHQAYRSSLTTRGNGRLDDYFVLRDTLLCYTTKDLTPLYFRKGAREGKRYTVDEVFYYYPDGKVRVKQRRQKPDGKNYWHVKVREDCVYDMMSIFLRARSFNPAGWKKGNVVNFPMADGWNILPEKLVYNGKTVLKADNGHKYRCLQLSYMDYDHGRYKEIARFYVTDDSNHIPVRLDMYLKFGSAKAFLVSMKGIRNKVASLVK